MADVVIPETRRRMMACIRGKDTKPEVIVRRALFSEGFRFRLHRKDLPGTPDIVLPRKKVVIFVHGCFWHRHEACKFANLPATRTEFWKAKLEGNADRDERAIEALREMGWRVLIVWECAIRDKKKLLILPKLLSNWISSNALLGSVSGGAPP